MHRPLACLILSLSLAGGLAAADAPAVPAPKATGQASEIPSDPEPIAKQEEWYTVVKGDRLKLLAKARGVEPSWILIRNKMPDVKGFKPGAKLILPRIKSEAELALDERKVKRDAELKKLNAMSVYGADGKQMEHFAKRQLDKVDENQRKTLEMAEEMEEGKP